MMDPPVHSSEPLVAICKLERSPDEESPKFTAELRTAPTAAKLGYDVLVRRNRLLAGSLLVLLLAVSALIVFVALQREELLRIRDQDLNDITTGNNRSTREMYTNLNRTMRETIRDALVNISDEIERTRANVNDTIEQSSMAAQDQFDEKLAHATNSMHDLIGKTLDAVNRTIDGMTRDTQAFVERSMAESINKMQAPIKRQMNDVEAALNRQIETSLKAVLDQVDNKIASYQAQMIERMDWSINAVESKIRGSTFRFEVRSLLEQFNMTRKPAYSKFQVSDVAGVPIRARLIISEISKKLEATIEFGCTTEIHGPVRWPLTRNIGVSFIRTTGGPSTSMIAEYEKIGSCQDPEKRPLELYSHSFSIEHLQSDKVLVDGRLSCRLEVLP